MDAVVPEPGATEPERVRDRVAAQPVARGAGLEDVLERICRAVVADLSLSGAAITVLPSAGTHLVLAASDEESRRIEELQFDAGEGPTGEASRTSTPVLVPDLIAQGLSRWPGFVDAATTAGVLAAFSLPLHVGAARLGTLTLYRSIAGALTSAEVARALIYADLAVETLIDSSLPGGLDRLDGGSIARTMDAQSAVYQAQGMVMVQLGVSLAEALARMRAHAFAQGRSLASVSAGIIAGTISLGADDTRP